MTGLDKASQRGGESCQKWMAARQQANHAQRQPNTNGKTHKKNRGRATEVLEREISGIEMRLEVLANKTCPELNLHRDHFNVATSTVIGPSVYQLRKGKNLINCEPPICKNRVKCTISIISCAQLWCIIGILLKTNSQSRRQSQLKPIIWR